MVAVWFLLDRASRHPPGDAFSKGGFRAAFFLGVKPLYPIPAERPAFSPSAYSLPTYPPSAQPEEPGLRFASSAPSRLRRLLILPILTLVGLARGKELSYNS